jgi:hypothetical protein
MTTIRLAEHEEAAILETRETVARIPTPELRKAAPQPAPPTYGAPQRDAIKSVMDGILGDICNNITELRRALDEIEGQVLQGIADAKHVLEKQIGVCSCIKDEIGHLKRTVAELRERASD